MPEPRSVALSQLIMMIRKHALYPAQSQEMAPLRADLALFLYVPKGLTREKHIFFSQGCVQSEVSLLWNLLR